MATPDDEGQVIGLLKDFMVFEKEALLSAEEYRQVFRTVIARPENTRFIVAETDAGLAGMATMIIGYSTWRGRRVVTIEDVYVRPDMRNRGIATALLTHIFLLAKDMDCARVDLVTETENGPARELYKKLGFTPVARIPFTRNI